jgi:Uma2 family endonuclease
MAEVLERSAIKGLTDYEFAKFCREHRDWRIEKDKYGKITMMEPTNSEAGGYNNEVNYEVTHWNRQTNLGKTFDSSTGFKLPNGATRSPDVTWILKERWEQLSPEQRQSFAQLPPDFVIELRSSMDDNLKDLKEKMVEYIENGVRLGWLLDRFEGKAHVYRADGSVSIFKNFDTDILSGEDILPNFVLHLSILK